MAYNNYFPASYQPMYYPQPYQQPTQQQPVQQQPQQIQYGNVIVVPSERDIDAYPVAPGNCVTFKVENENILITKTKPFSALADPIKERYVLHKEDMPQESANNSDSRNDSENSIDLSIYATKTEFEALSQRIEALEATIESIKPKKQVKKEKEDE